jgi:hypothetical protein
LPTTGEKSSIWLICETTGEFIHGIYVSFLDSTYDILKRNWKALLSFRVSRLRTTVEKAPLIRVHGRFKWHRGFSSFFFCLVSTSTIDHYILSVIECMVLVVQFRDI